MAKKTSPEPAAAPLEPSGSTRSIIRITVLTTSITAFLGTIFGIPALIWSNFDGMRDYVQQEIIVIVERDLAKGEKSALIKAINDTQSKSLPMALKNEMGEVARDIVAKSASDSAGLLIYGSVELDPNVSDKTIQLFIPSSHKSTLNLKIDRLQIGQSIIVALSTKKPKVIDSTSAYPIDVVSWLNEPDEGQVASVRDAAGSAPFSAAKPSDGITNKVYSITFYLKSKSGDLARETVRQQAVNLRYVGVTDAFIHPEDYK